MQASRVVLIVVLVSLLIGVGGVVTNYFLMSQLLSKESESSWQLPSFSSSADKGEQAQEYLFIPVQKIILSLRGERQEHYFVLDLVLQAPMSADKKKIAAADPMVRSSALSYLSSMGYSELRNLPIPELQVRLEKALLEDFAERKIVAPFQHVLVSKLVVQ